MFNIHEKGLWKAAERKKADITKYQFDYPIESLSDDPLFFEIPNTDRNWVTFYAEIGSKTSFDRGIKRTLEQKQRDNFYGLLGEKGVRDLLNQDRKLLVDWNERDPEFFEQVSRKPYDLALPDKQGGYVTLEIKTAKEYRNHRNMLIPRGNWKMSDYCIGVKMLKIEKEKEAEPFAIGCIAGFLEKAQVKRIPILEAGIPPCMNFACRAKLLTELNPIKPLFEKLKNECVQWKSV